MATSGLFLRPNYTRSCDCKKELFQTGQDHCISRAASGKFLPLRQKGGTTRHRQSGCFTL